MHRRHRRILILIVLALTSLLAAACTGPAPSRPPAGPTEQGTAADPPPSAGSNASSVSGPSDRVAVAAVPRSDEELMAALNPDVVAAHNRLGMLVFRRLVKEQLDSPSGPATARRGDRAAAAAGRENDGNGTDENIFLSPVSLALALGMAFNGAAGDTETAMAKALQLDALYRPDAVPVQDPGQEPVAKAPADTPTVSGPSAAGHSLAARNHAFLSRAEVNAANLALLSALAGQDARLEIANSIWYRKEFTFNPAFLEESARFYRARISALDFAAPESVSVINRWADEATHGLIPKVVERLDEDQVMMLVNAVYFKGDWTTPFDPRLTREMPFRPAAGGSRSVPMMYRDGRIEYFEDGFQAVRLPYGDDQRLAAYVFLPPEEADFYEFAASLDYETLAGVFGRFTPRRGKVLLPRIDVAYKTRLNNALQALGMGVAFDPGAADFSRFLKAEPAGRAEAGARGTATDGRNVYIGDVIHQSVLKVDEEGTEAAAVTAVDFRVTSAPVYDFRFEADRPFVVVIRDDATGALLFVGAVTDPGV